MVSDKVKEITDQLEEGIKALFDSDKYKEYLQTLSRFTSYSFNNTVLIAAQTGGQASLVAGYSRWKELNRQVKKGEKAIKIIAPTPYKKKVQTDIVDVDGNKVLGSDGKPLTETTEKIQMSFRVANVFDISQTEGEPLPEIAHKLDGSVEGFQDFMESLKRFSPVPIEFGDTGAANGYYDLVNKKIVINPDLSEMMKCKTGIHEIAHALLHDRDTGIEKDALPDSRTKEVQAESIAYTVTNYWGLDSSEYSFGYIAGWSSGKELSELKESMETIRNTSNLMITGIQERLDGIQMSREHNVTESMAIKPENEAIHKPIKQRSR